MRRLYLCMIIILLIDNNNDFFFVAWQIYQRDEILNSQFSTDEGVGVCNCETRHSPSPFLKGLRVRARVSIKYRTILL